MSLWCKITWILFNLDLLLFQNAVMRLVNNIYLENISQCLLKFIHEKQYILLQLAEEIWLCRFKARLSNKQWHSSSTLCSLAVNAVKVSMLNVIIKKRHVILNLGKWNTIVYIVNVMYFDLVFYILNQVCNIFVWSPQPWGGLINQQCIAIKQSLDM